MVAFLCGDRGFSEDRVRSGAKKLIKARSGSTQGRLDSFFTFSTTLNKRKVSDKCAEKYLSIEVLHTYKKIKFSHTSTW